MTMWIQTLADATAAAAPQAPLWSLASLIALLTLTALEVVLGIDNIVFIAILSGKLPESQRVRARQLGLGLALVTRILLLITLRWIIGLATVKVFTIPLLDHEVSWRDLILIAGGVFLIYKATHEIHHKVEGGGEDLTHPGRAPGDLASLTPGSVAAKAAAPTFRAVILQILLIDMVFSLDSVITAVGMARAIEIMIAAVIISVAIMLMFAGRISRFIERHPTMKMLALSFLLLIGLVLVADGLGRHIEKGYVYFAMAFSLGVETLNIAAGRKKRAKMQDAAKAAA